MANELQLLLESNRRWAARMTERNPRFFSDLADQQAPEYLWIGCSDSRVAANTIVGLMPGEIFVHRNVGNLVVHTDMNCLSVIQFAVEVLKVKHIIVCGHYGCGGVIASVDREPHGLIDNWLRHIRDTANKYADILDELTEPTDKLNALCEMNVVEQVLNVSQTTVVQEAWSQGQDVTIHGWIYDLRDGIMSDLGISIAGENSLDDLRKRPFVNTAAVRQSEATS